MDVDYKTVPLTPILSKQFYKAKYQKRIQIFRDAVVWIAKHSLQQSTDLYTVRSSEPVSMIADVFHVDRVEVAKMVINLRTGQG